MIRTPQNNTRIPLGIFDSDLTVSGSPTGAFVTASIVLIAFIAIPLARPFLLGTLGLGSALGFVLWWRHSRQPESGRASRIDGGDGTILNVTWPSRFAQSSATESKPSHQAEKYRRASQKIARDPFSAPLRTAFSPTR